VEPRPLDYLLAVAGALGISTAPIFVALSEAAPTPAAFWRLSYGFPVLAVLLVARPAGRRAFRMRGWRLPAALAGIFFAADLILWHHSIGLIGAGPSTLLANTQIVWLALFGLLFLSERPSAVFWAALPVIGFGLVLLAGGNTTGIPLEADRAGLAFGLAAGVCYAAFLICMRRSQRATSVLPEATLIVAISTGWLCVSGVGLSEGSLPVDLSSAQHGWLLLLGVGAQAFSWMAITAGIKRLPGHHGGLLLLSQPVSSLLLGWLVLGQALSWGRAAGAFLILAGVVVALLAENRPAHKRPLASDDDEGRRVPR
jgi:drug/metabolite transporter (DMT)-like permease